MSRRLFVAMLGLGVALFLMPQISWAAEDHIGEAIMHTKQAIEHGKMGHADAQHHPCGGRTCSCGDG